MINKHANNGERERLRVQYFRVRKEAGLPTGTEAEINAAIDRVLEKRAQKIAARDGHAATSPPRKAVQPPLFDAGTDTAETRKLAAAPAFQRLPTRAKRALSFLARRAQYGATPDEISVHLDIPAHSAPSIVGRLRDDGLVIATAERRLTRCNKNAVVYVAAATMPPNEKGGA